MMIYSDVLADTRQAPLRLRLTAPTFAPLTVNCKTRVRAVGSENRLPGSDL